MATQNVITYEKLYEILRMEKFRADLQKLPDDFMNSVTRYLEEKSKILEKQESKDNSMFESEVVATRRQLENVKKMLKEIYDRREAKVIQRALLAARSGSGGTTNLLDHEQSFYDGLLDLFSGYRTGVLSNLLQNKEIKKPKSIKKESKPSSQYILRFVEAVPRFMGENMQPYGPFEPEDVAAVPLGAAKILLKNNKAQAIEHHEKA
ncbi:hypothetical protein CL622_04645 [archaeon]|nr:hypothetical protein [archaeon]|tara:strand:- start:211 stop:831 length:621 start_codon:yes stop_codon:yes gene_type:complete